jgi:hypothetical protein
MWLWVIYAYLKSRWVSRGRRPRSPHGGRASSDTPCPSPARPPPLTKPTHSDTFLVRWGNFWANLDADSSHWHRGSGARNYISCNALTRGNDTQTVRTGSSPWMTIHISHVLVAAATENSGGRVPIGSYTHALERIAECDLSSDTILRSVALPNTRETHLIGRHQAGANVVVLS